MEFQGDVLYQREMGCSLSENSRFQAFNVEFEHVDRFGEEG